MPPLRRFGGEAQKSTVMPLLERQRSVTICPFVIDKVQASDIQRDGQRDKLL